MLGLLYSLMFFTARTLKLVWNGKMLFGVDHYRILRRIDVLVGSIGVLLILRVTLFAGYSFKASWVASRP
jgi:hypothetical protein